jgi:hypothetical protein
MATTSSDIELYLRKQKVLVWTAGHQLLPRFEGLLGCEAPARADLPIPFTGIALECAAKLCRSAASSGISCPESWGADGLLRNCVTARTQLQMT